MSIFEINERKSLLNDYLELFRIDISNKTRLISSLNDNSHKSIRLKARGLVIDELDTSDNITFTFA